MDGTMESMQSKMRLGEPTDIYYYNSKTLAKQTIPVVQDTKFFQALNNTQGGSSTFIISPNQGVSDVILAVKLFDVNTRPGATGANGYGGLAVSKAWGYDLVENISVRYGGLKFPLKNKGKQLGRVCC
jgi:hypothetical protein